MISDFFAKTKNYCTKCIQTEKNSFKITYKCVRFTMKFQLQLRIDKMLNRSFWYLSKVLLVFQVISFLKCWPNTSFKMLQSAVASIISQLRLLGPPNFLVHLHKKPEICIVSRKHMVREFRKTDLSEFLTDHFKTYICVLS